MWIFNCVQSFFFSRMISALLKGNVGRLDFEWTWTADLNPTGVSAASAFFHHTGLPAAAATSLVRLFYIWRPLFLSKALCSFSSSFFLRGGSGGLLESGQSCTLWENNLLKCKPLKIWGDTAVAAAHKQSGPTMFTPRSETEYGDARRASNEPNEPVIWKEKLFKWGKLKEYVMPKLDYQSLL